MEQSTTMKIYLHSQTNYKNNSEKDYNISKSTIKKMFKNILKTRKALIYSKCSKSSILNLKDTSSEIAFMNFYSHLWKIIGNSG